MVACAALGMMDDCGIADVPITALERMFAEPSKVRATGITSVLCVFLEQFVARTGATAAAEFPDPSEDMGISDCKAEEHGSSQTVDCSSAERCGQVPTSESPACHMQQDSQAD